MSNFCWVVGVGFIKVFGLDNYSGDCIDFVCVCYGWMIFDVWNEIKRFIDEVIYSFILLVWE